MEAGAGGFRRMNRSEVHHFSNAMYRKDGHVQDTYRSFTSFEIEIEMCHAVKKGSRWVARDLSTRPEEPRAEAPRPVEEECSQCGAGAKLVGTRTAVSKRSFVRDVPRLWKQILHLM